MRILFATHGYKPAYRLGGPIVSVSSLAEQLVRKGHEVTVFATNGNLDEDLQVETDRPVGIAGVEVWYFRREEPLRRWFGGVPYLSKSAGVFYAPQMATELERRVPGIDVVHTHIPFIYPSWAAAWAARRHGKPLFYHQRGSFDPDNLRVRRVKKAACIFWVERPIMRNAAALIALTNADRESFRALGVKTPIRVIPNGIDAGAFATAHPENVERRWNVAPDARVLLFLGRLHPRKGADLLLEAFLRLQEEREDDVLVFAGPDEWGLETAFRDRAARMPGAAGRVRFLGTIEGQEKADLLARADLFCLPSEGEGFSMAVLEAMASGTAVLLSPGCHFPEVEAAGAGRVVARASDALANALREMMPDPVRLRVMGEKARDLVRRDYTWDRVADQMLETYEEGLARRRGAA